VSITVQGVTFRYPHDAAAALLDVSARVAPGEVVAIVGPNGSGKSTLGRLMKGMLTPTEGSVTVDGLETSQHSLEARRRVGLVFQNPNSQIVNAVVQDEVAFGPENLGLPPEEIRRRVREAMEAAGLAGKELTECHEMSMAGKQRVALASVIAMEPDYLILDEPTAWIEPGGRWALLAEVLRWRERTGGGVVLITHRMDEAQVADRVYGVLNAEIVADGTPNDVLHNASIRERLGLDLPETYALAEDLLKAGLPVVPGRPVEALAESIWQS
jgi:energy-coupling factor transport system ATP-binding protein